MIVAIFIGLDRLGFASVIKNPERLVALAKKILFLTHATCPAWVGEVGIEGDGGDSTSLLLIQFDRPVTFGNIAGHQDRQEECSGWFQN